jgi:hypothetical protein
MQHPDVGKTQISDAIPHVTPKERSVEDGAPDGIVVMQHPDVGKTQISDAIPHVTPKETNAVLASLRQRRPKSIMQSIGSR